MRKLIHNTFLKKLDSEPVFNGQYLQTKIKSYSSKVITNFQNLDSNKNEIPKEPVACICLSAIGIDSTFNSGKNYFAQALLEQ